MHKVQRNMPPNGLDDKSKEWKKQLSLDKEVSVDKEWKNFKSSKLGNQTVEALNTMYSGCCMYCEGRVGITSYEQIEHFKPKSLYPELCFEYDNLHLACEICNASKGNKFDEKYIDPTKSNPREHIQYIGWKANGKDEIGKTMINLVKLNSGVRMEFRMGMCQKVRERLETICLLLENAIMDNLIKKIIIKSLEEIYETMKQGSPYCTMIEDNFKEEVDLIYNKLKN